MRTKNGSNHFLSWVKSFLAIALVSFVAMSCDDDDSDTPQQTVLDIAVSNDNFDVLEAAAIKAGTDVTDVLSGSTQITVFAPTDAAFVAYLDVANEAAAITAVNELSEAEVADLLTFHVIAGTKIESSDIADGTTAVTTARATNNKAFVTKSAAGVTINNARVTTADVDASNGVIHIIDAVLTPPGGDVIAVATSEANAANFGILAAALTKANLSPTLQAAGPFTVFAPTDDAFLATLRVVYDSPELTEGEAIEVINGLDGSSTPLSLTALTDILLYHVVPASGYSINLTNNQVLTTVKAAAPNTVTMGIGASVTVDGLASEPSTVTTANISATNGVIHVIDRVLLPN